MTEKNLTKLEKAKAKRKRRAERERPQPTKYALWNITSEAEKKRPKFR